MRKPMYIAFVLVLLLSQGELRAEPVGNEVSFPRVTVQTPGEFDNAFTPPPPVQKPLNTLEPLPLPEPGAITEHEAKLPIESAMLGLETPSINELKTWIKSFLPYLQNFNLGDGLPFSNPMLQWLFYCLIFMGGVLLFSVSLIRNARKKKAVPTPSFEEDPFAYPEEPVEPRPMASATSPVESPSFGSYLTDQPLEDLPPLKTPPETAESEAVEEAPVTTDFPQVMPQQVQHPPASDNTRKAQKTGPAITLGENLFVPPPATIAEAVRSSLGSRANPYLFAPFRLSNAPPNTYGGPKPKESSS